MFKIIDTIFSYLLIGNDDDPIRRYCQTEYKDNWQEKYYYLTGKHPRNNFKI